MISRPTSRTESRNTDALISVGDRLKAALGKTPGPFLLFEALRNVLIWLS
jgi:hypothetical protein